MELTFPFRRLVFIQVLLAIVTFCLAEGNPAMLLIGGALGALSWYVVEGPAGRPMPQWVIVPGAVAALCWLIPDLFVEHGNVIYAMGHFILWLQILMLYSKKGNRQYAELLALSLVEVVSAGVITSSILYGLFLALYCVIGLFTILLFQLKWTSDEVLAANQSAAPRQVDAGRPKAVAGRSHRWHFRFMAGGIGALCGLIAMLIFLVFPRASASSLSPEVSDLHGIKEAGFASVIQLDGAPINAGGKEAVLNVALTVDGQPIDDTGGSWLLRGAVLDSYSPLMHTWSRSSIENLDQTLDMHEEGLVLIPPPPQTPIVEGHVTQRMLTDRALFTLTHPSRFQSVSIRHVDFNSVDEQLMAADNPLGPLTYSFEAPQTDSVTAQESSGDSGNQPPGAASGSAGWPDQYALGWDTGTADQIRQWTLNALKLSRLTRDPRAESTPDDLLIAVALSTYLQHRFRYSLSPPPLSRHTDPIADFLLVRQEGHCELFAAGLAAALRSIGMRARVVSGFRVSEYNRVGGYFVVRQNHAHAWTEAFCNGGWVTLDATPPAAVAEEQGDTRGVLTLLRDLNEHIEFTWMNKVVSYDNAARNKLIRSTARTLRDLTGEKNPWIAKARDWYRSLPSLWELNGLAYAFMGVIVLAIIAGVVSLGHTMMVRSRRLAALRLRHLAPKERGRLVSQLRFYLQMLDLLERHGYVRPPWQSPFSFAQELARISPARLGPVVVLTETFYEVRFGHRALDKARQGKINASLTELEHALAH